MLHDLAVLDMQIGDEAEGFYILSAASLRATAAGKPFLTGSLSDRTGTIDLVVWDYTGELGPDSAGQVVKVRGRVSEYRGGRQFAASRIRPADANDAYRQEELVPTAPIDRDQVLREVTELIASMADPDYRLLAETALQRKREAFARIPAAKSVHHGFVGGLLMHTANMLRTADFLAELYAEVINRDLLLCGTLLHDMAKTEEFSFSPLGLATEYSAAGQLLGHTVMGAQDAAQLCRELGLPQEKAMLLQHLILSHHGEPEFGAAVRPMCAEAELLHLIDMIDSRMEIYAEALTELEPGSFSERIFALDKRIYRPES